MWKNCFTYYPDLLYPFIYLGRLRNPKKDGCLIVAEYVNKDETEIIGMAGYKAIHLPGDSTRTITRVSVDIRFGGLGVGTWLVKAVMALAMTKEAGSIPNYEEKILPFTPVIVSTTNQQAWNRFYGRLGFSEDRFQATDSNNQFADSRCTLG